MLKFILIICFIACNVAGATEILKLKGKLLLINNNNPDKYEKNYIFKVYNRQKRIVAIAKTLRCNKKKCSAIVLRKSKSGYQLGDRVVLIGPEDQVQRYLEKYVYRKKAKKQSHAKQQKQRFIKIGFGGPSSGGGAFEYGQSWRDRWTWSVLVSTQLFSRSDVTLTAKGIGARADYFFSGDVSKGFSVAAAVGVNSVEYGVGALSGITPFEVSEVVSYFFGLVSYKYPLAKGFIVAGVGYSVSTFSDTLESPSKVVVKNPYANPDYAVELSYGYSF